MANGEENTENTGPSKEVVNLAEALQQILSENLEINRQNASAIKDSVTAAKDLSGALGITNEQAIKINKANKDSANLNADINKQIVEREKGLRNTTTIQKDISKSDDVINRLNLERTEIQKKQMAAVKAGKIEEANILADINQGLQAQMNIQGDIKKSLDEELKKRKTIEDKLGLTGKLVKGISKIPLVGQFLDSKKALEAMEKKAVSGGDKLSVMGAGLNSALGDLKAGLTDPLFVITQLVNAGLDFDKSVTSIEKNLGVSRKEAMGLRADFSSLAADSGNLAINSKEIGKAFASLNEQFGTASTVLRDDILVESAKLMKLTGQSAESVANFAKFANISGKPMQTITKEARAAVVAAEQENGVRLNINKTLEEAGKVTGQISAQLGGNPAKIAKAAATAKQFGMELEKVAAAGKQLLNFEESINAELEAELLTGKNLNLERARLAALTGDYETLTKEINKNVGTFADFSKMNVLQQDALAKSIGMTTDELSDQLLAKANLEQLAQEARAGGDEDLAKQLEARSAQESFNDAVAKLKGLFTDIAGGPIAQILNFLTYALVPISVMASGLIGIIDLFKGVGGELTIMESLLGTIAATFLLIKGTMLTIKAVQVATNVAKAIGLGYSVATGKVSGMALVSGKKGLGMQVAKAAAKIFGSFTPLGPFGPPLAAAAILGMAGLVYGLSRKGDDVMSPGGSGGGYGNRTLMGPEGAIALNNKDTVIAGTNLFPKGDDVISKPAGAVSMTPEIDYDKMAQANARAMSGINITATTVFDDFANRSMVAQSGTNNSRIKQTAPFA